MIVTRVRPAGGFFPSTSGPQLDSMRRDIRRLADAMGLFPESGVPMFPLVNVSHDDEHVYVRAEVPGVAPSSLSVTVLHNKLTIAGSRELPVEADNVSYHRREREGGSFNRTIALPNEVDRDNVEASCKDGILTVTLPRAAAARPRQIAVKTA